MWTTKSLFLVNQMNNLQQTNRQILVNVWNVKIVCVCVWQLKIFSEKERAFQLLCKWVYGENFQKLTLISMWEADQQTAKKTTNKMMLSCRQNTKHLSIVINVQLAFNFLPIQTTEKTKFFLAFLGWKSKSK